MIKEVVQVQLFRLFGASFHDLPRPFHAPGVLVVKMPPELFPDLSPPVTIGDAWYREEREREPGAPFGLVRHRAKGPPPCAPVTRRTQRTCQHMLRVEVLPVFVTLYPYPFPFKDYIADVLPPRVRRVRHGYIAGWFWF